MTRAVKRASIVIVVVAVVVSAGCAGLAENSGESATTTQSNNQTGANSAGSLKSTPAPVTTSMSGTITPKRSTAISTTTLTGTRTAASTLTATTTSTDTATTTSTDTATTTSTDTATTTSTLDQAPKLSVNIKDASTTPGGNAEVQFTLTNDGSSTVSNVGIQVRYEEFPAGWSSTDVSNGDGNWNDSGGWSVSTLEPGQTKTGSLTMGIPTSTLPGQYQFPIQAIGGEGNVVDQSTATVVVEQASTSTPTDTPTGTPTSTPTDIPTDTQTEAPTDTPTDTQMTVNRENMQVVKIKALERESVSYEFVASGPVQLSSETSSSAQVNGKKGSGTVGNLETDTFLIPDGASIIEVRNLDYSTPIRVTVDGEEISVSGGPDVDKSNFDSNATITITGVGGNRSDYLVAVTGDVFATDETDGPSEAVYPDEIREEEVVGYVGDGGTDSYLFTGQLEQIANWGEATLEVRVNGKLIATLEPGGFLLSDEIPDDY